MPRKKKSPRGVAIDEIMVENSDQEEEHNNNKRHQRDDDDVLMDEDDDEDEDGSQQEAKTMMFSSQAPDSLTQDILPIKEFERNNLLQMSENQREKIVCDLARLVLFKAFTYEPIDRTKIIKEAVLAASSNNSDKTTTTNPRISTAIFDEVNIRLKNCFGFALRRIPTWMENMQGISKTVTNDRYYVVNDITNQDSRQLHAVHPTTSSVEKGLLMVILAFCYCKGTPRKDGSRWIHDKDLYLLLNKLDDNLPNEPPTTKRGNKANNVQHNLTQEDGSGNGIAGGETPDVDTLLHKFVHRDYLIKEKVSDEMLSHANDESNHNNLDEHSIFYCMGPRSAIEIGRRQIIYFCAEILDEQPDPTMMQELEGDDGEEEQDDEQEEEAAE